MLKDVPGFASFSVDDVEKARQFYGEILGLEITDKMGGLELHVASNVPVFVYSKPDHVPATYTVFNFIVENIEQAVDELSGVGVKFESYDSEYMKTDEKGIARGDGVNNPSMAWFKDPAGNVLSLIQISE
jgi:catechol 2,3-dioxygenase-like lactoylglutathione lyase family enzyme